MAIDIFRCASCGTPAYPFRALCPVCGGAGWVVESCETGVVEECTTVAGPPAVVLASVRVAGGAVVVAVLPAAAAPGTTVRLRAGGGVSVWAESSG